MDIKTVFASQELQIKKKAERKAKRQLERTAAQERALKTLRQSFLSKISEEAAHNGVILEEDIVNLDGFDSLRVSRGNYGVKGALSLFVKHMAVDIGLTISLVETNRFTRDGAFGDHNDLVWAVKSPAQ